ncbi:MAG: carbohydrate kinase [Cyanobacteria bacterium SZAS LIN-2]|nr:carbohydrate kinase [Cyanobacteria bacterium SZAS LIN-3]MBS1999775.1 carbohydrate kinase [Cyanobacteria bacterium SZAS LIN-2]MBS2010714.1 carbohydrate kinase [Cyanobacteria bacterium SZAS TMP-1]
MADVLCLGEILVDWVCTTVGAELDQAQSFTKAAGGAPANTAVGLARQGVPTAFIGRISDDAFGRWLRSILETEGINVDGAILDPTAQTRMAYVVTTATGDRKLAEFSRISCADTKLQPNDLKQHLFALGSVLHFGSISLIESPAAESTKKAVELARAHKMLVSYDPNVRISLWPSRETCKQTILNTLSWADVVKINEDELEFLTGSRERKAADELREEHNLPLLIITLDSRGAYFATKHGGRTVQGFQVELVEATGAGDGFNSGVLGGLLPLIKSAPDKREALIAMDQDVLAEIIRRANAIGAITCTKAGAIPALPTREEVETFFEKVDAGAPALN